MISGFQKINTLKPSRLFSYLLFFSLLSQGVPSFAQFVVFGPVQEPSKVSAEDLAPSSRQVNSGTLPFWDDFSNGIQASKWIPKGASYTETIGNKAPSIGMVLFDGVDEAGKSYSLQEKDQGEGDYLSSIPLDLSGIPVAQQATVYLSFYWQAGGKGEVPDSNDRLTLQILTPSGTWLTVWEKEEERQ